MADGHFSLLQIRDTFRQKILRPHHFLMTAFHKLRCRCMSSRKNESCTAQDQIHTAIKQPTTKHAQLSSALAAERRHTHL